jgi:hypothetical protein
MWRPKIPATNRLSQNSMIPRPNISECRCSSPNEERRHRTFCFLLSTGPSVGNDDEDNSMESQWFARYQCSFKGDQIQHRPLCYRCTYSIGGMAQNSVGRTDLKVIVHADSAGPHTAKMSLDFLEQNGMTKNPTHRTHRIWHRLISISLAMSSTSEHSTNSLIGLHFLTLGWHDQISSRCSRNANCILSLYLGSTPLFVRKLHIIYQAYYCELPIGCVILHIFQVWLGAQPNEGLNLCGETSINFRVSRNSSEQIH